MGVRIFCDPVVKTQHPDRMLGPATELTHWALGSAACTWQARGGNGELDEVFAIIIDHGSLHHILLS